MDDSLATISCVSAATLVTIIGQATDKSKHVTIRPIIGGFIVGALLLLIGLWSADVAKMFAVVLLVTALVVNGGPVFDSIGKVVS